MPLLEPVQTKVDALVSRMPLHHRETGRALGESPWHGSSALQPLGLPTCVQRAFESRRAVPQSLWLLVSSDIAPNNCRQVPAAGFHHAEEGQVLGVLSGESCLCEVHLRAPRLKCIG